MDHGMAIRAQGDQFINRVNSIVFPECSQRPEMVNVNETFSMFTVFFLKIEPATFA